MKKLPLLLAICAILYSCTNETEDIASPEIRVATAINNFRSKLTAPANGWRVEYQPTPESGIFLLLMDFNENGEVQIQSDVPDNSGEFSSQTTTYRIDNALGLELIFENYNVLHYLFELDQSQFGAEFEFYFAEEIGEDLVLLSKSDGPDPTVFTLTPAGANDSALLSPAEAENFLEFQGQSPIIFGGEPPVQQLYFPSKDLSVFWGVDVVRRIIIADFAGTGNSLEDIEINGSITNINASSGYGFTSGKLVLQTPISFNHSGFEYIISEISLEAFSIDGNSLCDINPVPTPVYDGSVAGIGNVIITKSLINSTGFEFTPYAQFPYAVNSLFVFDAEARSLYEEGSIAVHFPNASAFVFNYGYESITEPENAVGFYVTDDNGGFDTYLRLFTVTESIGNKLTLTLTDSVYYSMPITPTQRDGILAITNEIFEGNSIYASELPVDGAQVFRLFNPCNSYEFFLVK